MLIFLFSLIKSLQIRHEIYFGSKVYKTNMRLAQRKFVASMKGREKN